MLTLKNTSEGPRLVLMQGGRYEPIQPGETRTIDGSKVQAIPDGLEEIETAAAKDQGNVPDQPKGLDDKVGKKEDLSKLTVAELEERLGDDLDGVEGTGAEGKVIKADLIRALENR